MFWNSVSSVLVMLALIGVGFAICEYPWFGKTGQTFLSKFAVSIVIPAYMFFNILSLCPTREKLLALLKLVPYSLVTILFSLMVGLVLIQFFKIKIPQRGVFLNAVAFSNTVIIGFPMVEALFGVEALPTAMTYYMGNTLLFWTLGIVLLRLDQPESKKKPVSLSWRAIKKIFSPPLLGLAGGMIVVFLGISLPGFVIRPLEMLSQTVTPLSMIFIGSVLRGTTIKQWLKSKELMLILGARFGFAAVLMVAILQFIPLEPMDKQVFFILGTMPAMTQLGIVAKEVGSDYEFASVVVATTTLFSLLTVPFYMWVINKIF